MFTGFPFIYFLCALNIQSVTTTRKNLKNNIIHDKIHETVGTVLKKFSQPSTNPYNAALLEDDALATVLVPMKSMDGG